MRNYFIYRNKLKAWFGRDDLTSLPNGKQFLRFLGQLEKKRSGMRGEVGVIHFGIDNFKHFLMHNGHKEGDRRLLMVESLVRPLVSNSARLFRIGGDEFAVVVVNSDRNSIVRYAEAIREVCEKDLGRSQPAHCGAHDCLGPAAVSVSVGVSVLGTNELPTEAATRAVEQMDRAKSLGKNRVCI